VTAHRGSVKKPNKLISGYAVFRENNVLLTLIQLANNPAPTGSAVTGVALESPAAANRVRKSELNLQGWLVSQDPTVERLKAIAGQGIDSQADKACSRCTAWKPYEKQATCPSAAEANLQSFPDPHVFDGLLLSGWAGHCR